VIAPPDVNQKTIEIRMPQTVTFPTPLPVFVYGALRSGTTVFRLMLDSHGEIGNPGERDFLFDFITPDQTHPTGWRYDLDKLQIDRIFQNSGLKIIQGPNGQDLDGLDLLAAFLDQLKTQCGGREVFTLNIHRHIDKILAILPEARVIHMLRDPRDVARSSIGMGWASHIYYGVNHWIGTETDWDRGTTSLPEEQVLTLTYEGLFRDIETELRRVCDFLGVAWSPRMLDYHENSTYSPPDPSLVEQWRRKCTREDLAIMEGRAEALMLSRGYALSGPVRVPGVTERAALWFGQKSGGWRHGITRYGFPMLLGEKVTRRLGLSSLHKRLRNRMNVIDQALVK
jgi:hypothetical protein